MVETILYEAPRPQHVELLRLRALRERAARSGTNLTAPHRLAFYLTVLYTAGEGHHLVDGTRYRCGRGSLICVTTGQVHAFPADVSLEGIMFLFTPHALEACRVLSGPLAATGVFDHSLLSPLSEMDEGTTTRAELLGAVVSAEQETQSATVREDVLLQLFTAWLLLTQRYRTALEHRDRSPRFDLYLAFVSLIERRRGESRNARDYARWLGLSPRQLRRITSAVAGRSPKQLIDEDLIVEIKRQLLDPSRAIKAIAHDLGFDEPTAMARFFRRHTSSTPAAWRAQSAAAGWLGTG